MRGKSVVAGVLAVILVLGGLLFLPSVGTLAQTNTPTPTPPQSIPQIPMIVTGDAIDAPDGFKVIGRMTKGAAVYETQPSEVESGGYFLTVAPPDARFVGEEIVFFLEGA